MFNENTNRMKRFQWKWVFAAPLVAFGLVSCEEPDPTDDPGSGYPSNNISVQSSQQIALTEITAITCGSCIITQEAMEVLKARYEGRILPMSLHGGDTLFTDDMVNLYMTLGDDQSNPVKLFINGVQVTSDPYATVDAMIEADLPPVMGVGHATRQNDTAWVIYPRVEFYTDSEKDYYIQSYVMLDNIVAQSYGSIDLTQTSSDPRVQQGAGGNPSVWLTDAGQVDSVTYLYGQGDAYMHHDVAMYAGVNDTNVYGIPLSTVNPLGQRFLSGDIFGNQYTPMEVYVPKPDFDLAGFVQADLKVATVVWERIPGTPDLYVFVNGYYSTYKD